MHLGHPAHEAIGVGFRCLLFCHSLKNNKHTGVYRPFRYSSVHMQVCAPLSLSPAARHKTFPALLMAPEAPPGRSHYSGVITLIFVIMILLTFAPENRKEGTDADYRMRCLGEKEELPVRF